MFTVFNKTAIGYSHARGGTPCQDFSASYRDGERTIITACDGHGGEIYVRSGAGSKFASNAVMDTFINSANDLDAYSEEEIAEKLKLKILCKWNGYVERDLSEKPVSEKEIERLDESAKLKLKDNRVKAYGTTLIGAAAIGNKMFCVQIGDGGCFLIKQGELTAAFDYDGEPLANFTYSMSGEDAYDRIGVRVFDSSGYDGVACCTDGLLNLYGSVNNFRDCFIKPALRKLSEGKTEEVAAFIDSLGSDLGSGDDVSFSLMIKAGAVQKYATEV